MVAMAAPRADFTAPVVAALRDGTLVAALALLAGLGAIGTLAWRIARPLAALADEAKAIRRLDLAGAVPVRSRIAEIAQLAGAMDGMKCGLRLFGAYIPRSLITRLIQEGDAAKLGGTRGRVTVMFSDVQDFTTLAEDIAPEQLMRIASDYFEDLTAELLRCHATIDKYIGDAVMALWNALQDDPSHARNACEAALRARLLTDRLCDRFAARLAALLHPLRHAHGGRGGWECGFLGPNGLYSDRQHGEPGLAARGNEQALRHPHPDIGGNPRGGGGGLRDLASRPRAGQAFRASAGTA